MRGAVVPQVGAGGTVVRELVAHRIPGLAAVVGALDDLPEPATGLRGVQPIGVGGRSLEVVDFPPPEVGSAHIPLLARPVRRHDKRALARADQYPYPAHGFLLSTRVLPPLPDGRMTWPWIDRPT